MKKGLLELSVLFSIQEMGNESVVILTLNRNRGELFVLVIRRKS